MNRLEQARMSRHQNKIDRLVAAGEWSRALAAVIDFAQWADGTVEDADVWLDMTVSATRIVAHLEDPAEYRAFLVHFAAPFLGDEQQPRAELLDAFASIADEVEPAVMISIGRWLTDARCDWPLGPYLVAHFGEIATGDDAPIESPRRIADHFDLATRRAGRIDDDRWQLHCRLRHGSVLLTTGVDRRLGRQILGEIDWSRLSNADQLWMAVSLAASNQWTDRVRAMDILLDLHQSISTARATTRLTTRDLRRAAATIFKRAGLDLPEAEERRLEELSQTLFSGDERRQWNNFLTSRRELTDVATLPFDHTDEVVPLLEKLGAVDPKRWEPATRRLRILQSGSEGKYHASQAVPSPHRHDQRLPVADTVARLLDAFDGGDLSSNDSGKLRELIDELIDVLSGFDAGSDGAAARPVAVVWSRLLDNNELDLGAFEQRLTDLAHRHTSVAPPPSYGWWALAAHLFERRLEGPATVVANHARVTEIRDTDDEVQHFVASRALADAVDRTDTAAARRWLELVPV